MAKVIIAGAAGRMGRRIGYMVNEHPDLQVAAGFERSDSAEIGKDMGDLGGYGANGVAIADSLAAVIDHGDVIIDFTFHEATMEIARLAAQSNRAMVIGTTGLSDHQSDAIAAAGRRTPIVWAANMSLGVNLLLGLTEQVARALGPEAFDIEIVEIHHKHKVDAPSGTALALGEAAARGRDVALAEMADRGRDGLTGARTAGAIGFAALRGGDVVGDHSVVFAGMGERLELCHKATDRRIYAKGAVHAARWAAAQAPGLYGMADVLGLSLGVLDR